MEAPVGETLPWAPRGPLRYRKVCHALKHLCGRFGGTWYLSRGDNDAVMFLRMFERDLLESVPHWFWDRKDKAWRNTGWSARHRNKRVYDSLGL